MIKAMSGPYAHMGVKFMPTGGVTAANLADYLSSDLVACVGGTWIASKEAISAGKWDQIRQSCREVVEAVARIRGK